MVRRLLLAFLLIFATSAPAQVVESRYKLLVLAVPNTYHYEYIPIARDSFERMAKLHAFDMDWTAKVETFEGDLSKYDAVMFLNTSGDILNAAQRANFEAYMKKGGNAMVVHRGIITPAGGWPWYEKLVGRRFDVHPLIQTGVVTVTDRSFPATFSLPDRWIWTDEFYVLSNPYNVRITPVMNIDESSYDPTLIWPGQVSPPMGKNHPAAWHHRYEGGRVFVTALGHNAQMYRDQRYLDHLLGGLYWTATGRGETPR